MVLAAVVAIAVVAVTAVRSLLLFWLCADAAALPHRCCCWCCGAAAAESTVGCVATMIVQLIYMCVLLYNS